MVATDLDDGDVGEAGVGELLDRLDHGAHVGPAGDLLLDVVVSDELAGRVEGGRTGQLAVDLPAAGEPTELFTGARDGGLRVGVVGHPDLADARLAAAAGRIEGPTQPGIGLDGDHGVGQLPRQRGGLRPGDGDAEVGQGLGQVPDPGRPDLEVLPLEVHVAPGPKVADDVYGLAEHGVADVDAGPAIAHDVLVEVLPRPEPEGEPAL